MVCMPWMHGDDDEEAAAQRHGDIDEARQRRHRGGQYRVGARPPIVGVVAVDEHDHARFLRVLCRESLGAVSRRECDAENDGLFIPNYGQIVQPFVSAISGDPAL